MYRMLIAAALALVVAPAVARDNGQYAQVDPAIREWVNGLKDANGYSCCATADGWKPEEVYWDADENGYRVQWRGEWFRVPDEALIKQPNRLGYPTVWIAYKDGKPFVRCFLPGGGT